MDIIAGLLQTSILAGGVLALAALGEVLSERVGVVNLGVEGLMALGAITAIAIVTASPNPALGLIGALGVGFVVGMIFASATVVLRANQVLCGLALTLMGTGLAATIGKAYSGMPAPATASAAKSASSAVETRIAGITPISSMRARTSSLVISLIPDRRNRLPEPAARRRRGRPTHTKWAAKSN